jgi:hypothetical protein
MKDSYMKQSDNLAQSANQAYAGIGDTAGAFAKI